MATPHQHAPSRDNGPGQPPGDRGVTGRRGPSPFYSMACIDREHGRCRQAEARPPEPEHGISFDPCACPCHTASGR